MARIPTQTEQTVFSDGGRTPSQSISASPAAFGGLQSEAVSRLGDTLSRASDPLAQRAIALQGLENETRAKDADIELVKGLNDLQYNPQSGYLSKAGKNAVDGFQTANDAAEELFRQVSESITNPQARRMFDQVGRQRVAGAVSGMSRHAAGENRRWQFDTSQARAATEIQAVGLNYTDDQAFNRSVVTAKSEALAQGEIQGWGPEQVKVREFQYVDQAWAARLQAWAVRDPVAALGSFQVNQNAMSADLRSRMSNNLFSAAAPLIASTLLQPGKIETLAATEAEALSIVQVGDQMGVPVSVRVDPKALEGKDATVFDRMAPDEKLKVMYLARTQANQQNAQVKNVLKDRIEDTVAAYERGVPVPNAPSRGELVAGFGEQDGNRLADRMDNARQFGEDVRTVAVLPASEQARLLSGRQPQAGEGFADAQRRQDQLLAAVRNVQKEREQDPALFAVRFAPQVQQAYDQLARVMSGPGVSPAERSAAAQAYAQATLAEQQRLEIQNPQILPKPMVDAIARKFNAPTEEGMNLGTVLHEVADQWGRYWPQVGAQLKKSIPPGAVVIGLGVKPEAEQLLSEAFRLKPEALYQGMDDATKKELRENVRLQLEPLQRTLAWQSGGQETYDNYADSADALAALLVSKGMKPKEAAAKAFEGLSGFKYEFQETWRVPKAVLGADVTPRSLRAGAAAAKFDMTQPDNTNFMIPDVPPGVRTEDAAKQWRETVRDNGFWVTSPGDGGLTLFVRSGLGAQPVFDERGRPVLRTWEELHKLGTPHTPASFSISPDFGAAQKRRDRNVDADR